MNDDFNIGDSSKKSSSSAKKGRRAKKEKTATHDEQENFNSEQDKHDDAPPKPRRMGGWGEEDETSTPPQSGVPRSGRRRGGTAMKDEGAQKFTNFDSDAESDNEIPVIPDLEDVVGEDDTTNNLIAVAPSMAVNKVASYKELDNDLARNSQFSTLDGEIDLKLLTRFLVSENECKEDDKPWTWDHLFTDVSSELLNEWDNDSGDTEPAIA